MAVFGLWRLGASSDDGGPSAQYVPSRRTTTVVSDPDSVGAVGEAVTTTGPLTAGPLTAGPLTAGPLTAGPLTAGPPTSSAPTAGLSPSPSPGTEPASPGVAGNESVPPGDRSTTTTPGLAEPNPRPPAGTPRSGSGLNGGIGGEAGG